MSVPPATDPFRLERFVDAQSWVYERALGELERGRKSSHWMWFVFPQLAGLGRSPTARLYGIGSIDEARAYLAHPLLGPRLAECTEAVLGHPERSLHEIFGSPDDLKFRSSMTLFALVSGESSPFADALAQFCGGERDLLTLALIDPPDDDS